MSETEQPATVTQFAVEQGTLDADAPGVQETIDAEKQRAEEHTERAQAVSDAMNDGGAGVADNDPAEDPEG